MYGTRIIKQKDSRYKEILFIAAARDLSIRVHLSTDHLYRRVYSTETITERIYASTAVKGLSARSTRYVSLRWTKITPAIVCKVLKNSVLTFSG